MLPPGPWPLQSVLSSQPARCIGLLMFTLRSLQSGTSCSSGNPWPSLPHSGISSTVPSVEGHAPLKCPRSRVLSQSHNVTSSDLRHSPCPSQGFCRPAGAAAGHAGVVAQLVEGFPATHKVPCLILSATRTRCSGIHLSSQHQKAEPGTSEV